MVWNCRAVNLSVYYLDRDSDPNFECNMLYGVHTVGVYRASEACCPMCKPNPLKVREWGRLIA